MAASVLACKKDAKQPENVKQEIIISDEVRKNLPQIIALTGKAKATIETWTEFTDFDSEFRRIYEKDIDLKTLYTELIRREKELKESKFPEKFDNPAVRSRLLVLQTYLGRALAGLQENNLEQIATEKAEVIKAYNALRMQFMEVWKKNIAEEFLKNDSL